MQWFENEDFWVNFGPVMFDAARWAEASGVAAGICGLCGLKKGDSVLDAGCGIGRICTEMAALGMRVTGVDLIQSELETARETAQAEGVFVELVRADLRDFCRFEGFDAAISTFTSIGYCDTVKEDMRILKNICDSVKKGGSVVIESLSRETAILYFTQGEEFERDGMKVRTKFSVEGAWEGLVSEWTVTTADKKTFSHRFVQRLYPADFLRDKLISFGFRKAEVFGDFDRSPYNQNARTMVLYGLK